MKSEQEIERASVDLVRGLLEEIGAREVELVLEGASQRGHNLVARWRALDHWMELVVVVRTRYSHASLDEILVAGKRPVMLVAPRFGPQARAMLRAKGINHADFGGVVYLRLPGVLIDRERVARANSVRWAPNAREANPFSKKASRVLRVMLANPKQPLRITDIASVTGLAVGWASGVADAIVKRGYAEHRDTGVLLTDSAAAIIDWTRAYNWRRNLHRSYRVPMQREEIVQQLSKACEAAEVQWSLTLLTAAERRVGYVRDAGPVHVYLSGKDALDITSVLEGLYAEESPSDGELVVLDPYYGESTYIESMSEAGVRIVSDLQLFLDLVDYPVRGHEVAEVLLRSRLAKTLALSSGEVQRVMEAVG